jgi:hypothetical protein
MKYYRVKKFFFFIALFISSVSIRAEVEDVSDQNARKIDLVNAINQHNPTKVRLLIEKYPELLNAILDEGRTPLMQAVHTTGGANLDRRVVIAEYLLSQGADINQKGVGKTGGKTALMVALASPKPLLDMIELLLDQQKLDVTVTDDQGNTALMYALLLPYTKNEILVQIKKRYFKIPDVMLHVVDKIMQLAGGPKVVNQANAQGMTPLMVASRLGRLEAVEKLIQNDAHVNAVNNEGNTALIEAARAPLRISSKVKLTGIPAQAVDFMQEYGEWLLTAIPIVGGPLAIARLFSKDAVIPYFEIVKELVANGADVLHANNEGKTAIDLGQYDTIIAIRNASAIAPLRIENSVNLYKDNYNPNTEKQVVKNETTRPVYFAYYQHDLTNSDLWLKRVALSTLVRPGKTTTFSVRKQKDASPLDLITYATDKHSLPLSMRYDDVIIVKNNTGKDLYFATYLKTPLLKKIKLRDNVLTRVSSPRLIKNGQIGKLVRDSVDDSVITKNVLGDRMLYFSSQEVLLQEGLNEQEGKEIASVAIPDRKGVYIVVTPEGRDRAEEKKAKILWNLKDL